jgi:alkylation response protein AidB-like acyl-CoA dehydrogenase
MGAAYHGGHEANGHTNRPTKALRFPNGLLLGAARVFSRYLSSGNERPLPVLSAGRALLADPVPELGELGLLGASLSGYGCAGMAPVAYGHVLEELEHGDSALRSFVSVQGWLAMYAIHAFGTDAQRERFLPDMAKGKLIGCFGLTEPDTGSDRPSLGPSAARRVVGGARAARVRVGAGW